MPTIISGTTGISGTDGTAATPAVQGTDTNTGIFFPAADTIAFAEGGTEVMRLDASGNLGVGTQAPNFNAVTGTVCHINNNNVAGWSLSHYTNGTTGAGASDGLIVGLTSDGSNAYIYNYEAAAIYFGTSGVERARITSGGDFGFNSGYGSVAVAYGCRAWVNFNGTGTVAIRASGNVSSITDNDVGDYTINFTNAMPDTNYSVSGFAGRNSTNALVMMNTYPVTGGGYATTSVRLYTIASNGFNSGSGIGGNNLDVTFNVVAIFR